MRALTNQRKDRFMARNDITPERIRELLRYDPRTGELRWLKSSSNRAPVGSIAGSKDSTGYVRLGVDGAQYQAHRIAWLHIHGMWPDGDIDHINGNRADNRIENLRVVTNAINCQNKRRGQGRSGLIGAHWFEPAKLWQSSIRVNGKTHYLGYFRSPEDAHVAYVAAKRRLHEGCTI